MVGIELFLLEFIIILFLFSFPENAISNFWGLFVDSFDVSASSKNYIALLISIKNNSNNIFINKFNSSFECAYEFLFSIAFKIFLIKSSSGLDFVINSIVIFVPWITMSLSPSLRENIASFNTNFSVLIIVGVSDIVEFFQTSKSFSKYSLSIIIKLVLLVKIDLIFLIIFLISFFRLSLESVFSPFLLIFSLFRLSLESVFSPFFILSISPFIIFCVSFFMYQLINSFIFFYFNYRNEIFQLSIFKFSISIEKWSQFSQTNSSSNSISLIYNFFEILESKIFFFSLFFSLNFIQIFISIKLVLVINNSVNFSFIECKEQSFFNRLPGLSILNFNFSSINLSIFKIASLRDDFVIFCFPTFWKIQKSPVIIA